MKELTLTELKNILTRNELEYFIKKQDKNIVKIHFYIKEESS